MKRIDPETIVPRRRLFAAVSPVQKNGKRWIDYSSLSYTAKGAREHAAQYWQGGWADLRKRGWTVARVDVVPSRDGLLAAALIITGGR